MWNMGRFCFMSLKKAMSLWKNCKFSRLGRRRCVLSLWFVLLVLPTWDIHWLLFTALPGKLKWQKNIQSFSRLLRECPSPGLQNEPPLDSLDLQSPNPIMASPSPDPIQRLAIKGFRDWGSRLSSGGSFRSPGWGRSRSSLEIDWIFFCHFNFSWSAVGVSLRCQII